MSWSERLVTIAVLLGPSAAHADKATADAAFATGKRLMGEGKIAEACPKFALSFELDAQLGTLLNLADCHEQEGKLASAWAEFKAAEELAKNRGDKRGAFARERREKLEGRISYLAISKTGEASGLRVRLDQRDITELIGTDIPIDPGDHTIGTRIGEGAEVTSTIKVLAEKSRLEIVVPLPGTSAVTARDPLGGPPQGPQRKSRRKLLAVSTGAVGLVATGIGLYFGRQAYDRYDQSRAFCDEANACEPAGAALIEDANDAALRSSVLVGLGVGALVVGTVLWLTAPDERVSRVTARPVLGPSIIGGALDVRF